MTEAKATKPIAGPTRSVVAIVADASRSELPTRSRGGVSELANPVNSRVPVLTNHNSSPKDLLGPDRKVGFIRKESGILSSNVKIFLKDYHTLDFYRLKAYLQPIHCSMKKMKR